MRRASGEISTRSPAVHSSRNRNNELHGVGVQFRTHFCERQLADGNECSRLSRTVSYKSTGIIGSRRRGLPSRSHPTPLTGRKVRDGGGWEVSHGHVSGLIAGIFTSKYGQSRRRCSERGVGLRNYRGWVAGGGVFKRPGTVGFPTGDVNHPPTHPLSSPWGPIRAACVHVRA